MVIAILLASVAVFACFVVIERRAAQPMLDLEFFRSPGFIGVQVLAASPAFLFIVLIVMLPGRFIGIDGYSALQAGQMMVWLAAPLLVVPFLAALLTRWLTPRLLCSVGLFLVAGGLIGLAHGFAQGGAALPLPLLLIGIGIGLPWGLMDALAVSVVTPERVGMATGIFNTVRVSADGVAIAMISALLATLIQNGMALEIGGAVSQAALLEAASRTALGELHTAVSILPDHKALLLQRYAESFITAMYVLAGIAALTACAVFVLLREQSAGASTRQRT